MWPIHTLSTFRLSLKDYQTSKENQRSEENLQRENGHQNKGIGKKKSNLMEQRLRREHKNKIKTISNISRKTREYMQS